MTIKPTLFVAGANGKLGRRVVELLIERGAAGRLIAGSRTPEALDDLAARGVTVRKADYADPAGLAEALRGIDRMLLVSADIVGPARQKLHADAAAAAKAAGVGHLVYTSMPNPAPDHIVPMGVDHFATEEAIKATGLNHTLLRMSWYAENLIGGLTPALAMGKWFSASGEGRIAHVSREDCAKAAAGALLAAEGGSRTLTVTGPAAHTNREIAAVASRVAGRPLEVVDVGDEAFVAGAQQAGFPPDVARLFLTFEINQRNGGMNIATDAVETLWGAPAQSLGDFLAANRPALLAAAAA